MLFYIGLLIVVASIIGGFAGEGGNLMVLVQPYAALIIIGSAVGIFVISNPQSLLKSIWYNIHKVIRSNPYSRADYLDLLVFQFNFFRFARSRSVLELESHIESPLKSHLFKDFPKMLANREAVVFFCDYMRMMVLGYDNSYELDNMMQEQIEVRKNYSQEVCNALFKIADTLPALGIIAAVLGVVNAMGSINAPPEVMGHKIGSALIGTFLGVVISYCFVLPIGIFLEKYGRDEAKYLECIKAGFLAHVRGNPPSISIEFARQSIPTNLKPSFFEVEKAIENLKLSKRAKKNVRREQQATAG